jgi:putative ABC transport system permease protein
LTVTVTSAQRAVTAEATTGNAADYRISNSSLDGGLEADAAHKAGEVPGVSVAAPLTSASLEIGGGRGIVTGAGLESLGPVTELHFTSGSLDRVGQGRIAVSQEFAKRTGLSVGDTARGRIGSAVTSGGAEPVAFEVTGVYESNRTVGDALGALDDVLPFATGKKLDSVLVKGDTEDRSDNLADRLRTALGNSPLLKVQDKDQLVAAELGVVDTVLNMMYGLLSMAVLIAVLGVINTLAMSVFERTREIGMLRAIGLDRSGIRQMVRLESLVICLFGAVLGIGSGVFLAWLNSGVAGGNRLSTYETALPWARLALFALLSLIVGVLAAIWPARRASRFGVLQAISTQ